MDDKEKREGKKSEFAMLVTATTSLPPHTLPSTKLIVEEGLVLVVSSESARPWLWGMHYPCNTL